MKWKNAVKTSVKAVLFLAILAALFMAATRLLRTKWVTQNQEEYIYSNLYDLNEDSLDVLILGNSQAVYGFSPVEMYDYAGISAYSLGGSSAALMSNYYWMLETCKTQSPSLVILDVSGLLEPFREHYERERIDVMRFSQNKIDNILAMDGLAEDSLLSYFIPMLKYHSRWSELEGADFGYGVNSDLTYRGQDLEDYCKKGLTYSKLIIDNDDPEEDLREMYDYQLEYFDNIYTYCQENDMELLLVKTPKYSWIGSDAAQVQELADSYGLTYIDFNWEEMLNVIGYDITTDMKDSDHLNVKGAEKLSDWLCDYIRENYDLPDRREDETFDLQINRELYETERTDAYLCSTTDPVEWLTLLKEHSDCDIFLSLYGDATGLVSDEMAALLADLGLKTDLTALSDGECLVAWLTNDGASVEEKTADGYVRIHGEMENGVAYDIASRNRGEGEQMTRLSIGGEDQSINTAGLNITVYDQEQDLVIETVCIDLETGEMTCVTRADS
ncbi:MAG: hypothetical protein LUG17_00800 [Clostridiales bacterium]|nr:hypothetical protein [Clostridiales bacterium]